MRLGRSLGSGFARTATQLLIFQAVGGIADSLCLPSAVGIVDHQLTSSKSRRLAYTLMGAGQGLGFATGLCGGGLLTGFLNWRWSFHAVLLLDTLTLLLACTTLFRRVSTGPPLLSPSQVDLIGLVLLTICFSLLTYLFT